MACGSCKKKNPILSRYNQLTILPYNSWKKAFVNEVSLMYETIFNKHQKTPEDWKVIFDIHQQIFTNTTIRDYNNLRLRQVVYENLNLFYKQFLEIKDKKGW